MLYNTTIYFQIYNIINNSFCNVVKKNIKYQNIKNYKF